MRSTCLVLALILCSCAGVKNPNPQAGAGGSGNPFTGTGGTTGAGGNPFTQPATDGGAAGSNQMPREAGATYVLPGATITPDKPSSSEERRGRKEGRSRWSQ